MALWKNGAFVADSFSLLADDADVPAGGDVIVTLARYLAERDTLLGHTGKLGVLVPPGSDWSALPQDFDRLGLIAVEIPKFADGRGFSIGRLLRERDGYAGELRAIGGFFLDQIPFLKRVGFDSFQTEDPLVIKGLADGRWPEVTEYLQPAFERGEVPAGTRPWARKPAPASAE